MLVQCILTLYMLMYALFLYMYMYSLIASGIGLQIYQELNIISQLLVVHEGHVLLLKV